MLHISDAKIIFEGRATAGIFGAAAADSARKFIEIDFADLMFVFTRRYLHADVGCEVFTVHRRGSALRLTRSGTIFSQVCGRRRKRHH
jgi:hypothetical protein